MNLFARKVLHSQLDAVVTRADGTIEDLGTVAAGYRCLGCGGNFATRTRYRFHLCWWVNRRS